MAVKEQEFYHGAVLNRLFKTKKSLNISVFPNNTNCAYVINKKVGIYIKFSGKKISPWRFSFYKHQQDDLQIMKNLLPHVFLILVCWHDGIIAINFKDLKKVLDHVHDDVEWLSASRLKREKYSIKGSDGKLKFKIAESDYPKKILELI